MRGRGSSPPREDYMDTAANLPQIPLVGSKSKGPKDASKDPNAKHYAVVLRAGAGHKVLTFSVDNDTSACVSAMFLAMQYFPKVHTFEVYRKKSGDPNVTSDIDVGEGICMVPMSQLLKFAAPQMEPLTGFKPPVLEELVTPIDRHEQGVESLSTNIRNISSGGKGQGGGK